MPRATSAPGSCSGYTDDSRSYSRCVIIPTKVSMTAEALERKGHSRLVLTRRTNGETTNDVKIDNLPTGAKTLESVVRFCYGLAVDLTATNIVSIYTAAHFLEMSEDLEEGNLISKTEAFLNFAMFWSWKDTTAILRSCEAVRRYAEELQIPRRCIESITRKACTDPQAISCNHDNGLVLNILNTKACNNNNNNSNSNGNNFALESWWFEDVSLLKYYYFVRAITAIKAKGMKPALVGACIMHWAAKYFSRIELTATDNDNELKKNTLESLIMAIPKENGYVSCNFLLRLLKLGLVLGIDNELAKELERRVGMVLTNASSSDLLVKNYGDEETVYDVGLVRKVAKTYIDWIPVQVWPEKPALKTAFARILDGYLAQVATDDKLSVESFRSVLEVLPENSRECSDGLYRAVDMYMKAHPCLTEEERKSLCSAIEYHKLSLKGRIHATKNDRLPLRAILHLLLVEQLHTTRLILAKGCHYHGIESAHSKEDRERWIETQNQLLTMKEEMEKMKVQLNELQQRHGELEVELERHHSCHECNSRKQRKASSFFHDGIQIEMNMDKERKT